MNWKTLTRRPIAILALCTFAALGIGSFTNLGCNELVTWDPATQSYVPVDPITLQPALAEGGDIAKVALTATGQVVWLPFVDLAVRLIALFAAFRFQKPVGTTTATTPQKV